MDTDISALFLNDLTVRHLRPVVYLFSSIYICVEKFHNLFEKRRKIYPFFQPYLDLHGKENYYLYI